MRKLAAIAMTLAAGGVMLVSWAYDNRVMLLWAISGLLVGYTVIGITSLLRRTQNESSLDIASGVATESESADSEMPDDSSSESPSSSQVVAFPQAPAARANRVMRFVCNTKNGTTFLGLLPYWEPGTVVLDHVNIYFEAGHFAPEYLWKVGYSEIESVSSGGLVGNHVILRTKDEEFTLVTFSTAEIIKEIEDRCATAKAVSE